MFNTYMNQFICSHNGVLIREISTNYLNARGISKKTCFLCEELTKIKTPDFTRGKLHDRVKLFSMQQKIVNFHSECYIKQIQNTWKNNVADVRHKAFESTPVDISNRSDYAEIFGFDPDGQIQNEFFD